MARGGLSSGLSFVVLTGLFLACSAQTKPERACTPNANVYCRCADKEDGTKKCKPDGQSFEACVPCDGSGDPGPGSGGSDGLGSRGPEGSPVEVDPTAPPAAAQATVDAGETGTTTGTSAGKTGKTNAANAASFPDTQHCKPLDNAAPKIEAQMLADEMTSPTGGRPADGLYYQAWVVQFTGDGGDTGPTKHYSQETLEIDGDVGRYVFSDDEGQTEAGGFRLSKVSGQNKLDVEYECPATAPKQLAYDATDSTLILYDPPYARVFYKQAGEK